MTGRRREVEEQGEPSDSYSLPPNHILSTHLTTHFVHCSSAHSTEPGRRMRRYIAYELVWALPKVKAAMRALGLGPLDIDGLRRLLAILKVKPPIRNDIKAKSGAVSCPQAPSRYLPSISSPVHGLYSKIMALTRKGPFICSTCNKEFKKWSRLMAHERREHDPNAIIKHFPCQFPNCNFTTKHKGSLNNHVTTFHNPDAEQFACQFPDCKFVTKLGKARLKQHALVHDPDAEQFPCEFPGCLYTTKYRPNLRLHALLHDADAKQFACEFPDCNFTTKHKPSLKKHAIIHDPDAERFACEFPGCEYVSTDKKSLKEHALVHDPDAEQFACQFPGCVYTSKRKKNLKQHVIVWHDPDAKQFACQSPGCKFVTKYAQNLRLHEGLKRCALQEASLSYNGHESADGSEAPAFNTRQVCLGQRFVVDCSK
ncbi:hypothetical protein CC1G_03151 [Coprinopsis cinerea okayama7|uniref:C2H2-type domain-containing protein n=1 Tax=Coprinopsis cinerea (strain Okayama-7 / 130 / ATCC MYA-4618 / FGSC 9003) TaxID=240176 RepID=A8PF44_COPC7|nr:hypothetical protein CC1G_03151 [Coprinopsis cinerea okayama7\|eukprot:XP_001840922.2 hypothetical protein CC1G_03151 [Coprinopsis cinerea okayama7\